MAWQHQFIWGRFLRYATLTTNVQKSGQQWHEGSDKEKKASIIGTTVDFVVQTVLILCTQFSATVQSLNASRPHPRQRLRSTSSTDFSLPQLCTKFGEHAFSHAGPSAWNSLLEHIRAQPDIRVFRKLLKTHLFNL